MEHNLLSDQLLLQVVYLLLHIVGRLYMRCILRGLRLRVTVVHGCAFSLVTNDITTKVTVDEVTVTAVMSRLIY